MTKEELKQEIRNNIKPNLRQEILGSTLQQVLVDMVDYTPTGSGGGGGELPEDVATRQWVLDQDYATEGQLEQEVQTLNERIDQIVPPEIDLSNYVEKGTFEEFTGSVAETYATKRDLRLTSESISSSLGSYATKQQLDAATASLSQSIAQVRSEIPSLDNYATKQYVSESIASVTIDTSSLATKQELNSATSSLSASIAEVAGNIPDVSNFATKQEVTSSVNALSSSVAQTYETKADFQTISGSFNTRINSVSSSIPDVSDFPTRTEVSSSINTATSSLSASLAQRISQVEQEIPSLNGYATETWVDTNYVSGSTFSNVSSSFDSRINGKVDTNTFNTVSGSFDTRINQKADNYSTTYPQNFSGPIDCSYDMNVVVITDSLALGPTLSLTNPTAGQIVHCVFITNSGFSSSWSLAIPTSLIVGQDTLPVYLNGARLTSGDTLTLDAADKTAEMSILITSISVNIITYQA